MPSTSHHKSKRSESAASSSSSSSSLTRIRRDRSRTKHKHTTEQYHHHKDRRTTNLLNVQKRHVVATTKQDSNGKQEVVTGGVVSRGRVHKEVEQMELNDIDVDVIDLCTPVNETAPDIVTTNYLAELSLATKSTTTTTTTTTTISLKQTEYKPRTLKENSGRYSILPAFPTSKENSDRPHLLLANVPEYLLNEQERDRRRSMKYRAPFHVIGTPPNNVLLQTMIPSFFWPIYQDLFANISEHLHIDMAIIDYNYARLSKCIDLWTKEQIFRFKQKEYEVTLDQKEYGIALEFYLQIDVDLFYMKTCSFRNVIPQEENKFLFCITDPMACYEMTACGNCGLCYPKYDVKRRRQPSINFGTETQRHVFVNGYETILNCPCSCDTSNIIYVLTCPCGKFDYVGETGSNLSDRIQAHRFHGNRIMHETFLGKENIKLAYPNMVKPADVLAKDDMHLYRHSTECPAAIQIFLDENPRYWRFVPMSNEEANQPMQNILTSTMDIKLTDIQEDDKIKAFIQNLPIPPPNYQFSKRQYHLQYVFFKSRRNFDLPNEHLDLYNAKIIAVLPETGSKVLRKIVEALFITHAETKLNSASRLVADNIHNNSDTNKVPWCEGFVRRPLPSLVTATMMSSTSTIDLSK